MNRIRRAYSSLPKYNFGVHFLTAVTYRRIPYFRVSAWARIFCQNLEQARREMGFHVLAFVLMPDHVHLLVWWDPEENPQLTISRIAWAVKGRTARQMVQCWKLWNRNKGVEGVGDGIAVPHPGASHPGASHPAAPHPEKPHPGAALDCPQPTPAEVALANRLLKPARQPAPRPHYRNWRYRIWQKGAGYDFNVFTRRKLLEKIRYIHANPVRDGLADTAEAYPWSSAACYAGLPSAHGVAITPFSEVFP